MEQHSIKYISYSESQYHFKFLQVPSKPGIIYYMGDINLLNQPILGIVGPRIASNYGKKVVSDLIEKASDYQLITISGGAEGIDTLCHNKSIEHKIPTIAVLGGGFRYYLNNRKQLIDEIIGHGGLVLSEFKIGFKPTPYSFPQRNRIIAGLSDVVFLPEASEKSGSLITVDFALKSGKPVFATPNDIFSIHSTGVNKYISEQKIQSIYNLDSFLKSHFRHNNISNQEKNQAIDLDPDELAILKLLEAKPMNIDELISGTQLNFAKLSTYLSILEIQGLIYQSSARLYALK